MIGLLAAMVATSTQVGNPAARSANLSITLGQFENGVFASLEVDGREVLGLSGAYSGLKRGGWATSRTAESAGRTPEAKKLKYAVGEVHVEETWTIRRAGGGIDWRIDRKYLSSGMVDDVAMPCLNFKSMETWRGAILATGGVAWCKLFDAPNATYAVHTDSALFWKRGLDACLSIKVTSSTGHQALRFTRMPEGAFQLAVQVALRELQPKQDQYRFFRGNQEVWAPFEVRAGDSVSTTLHLSVKSYEKELGRGELKGIDGKAVGEILNTIGRIGVIDDKIMGSNGWYSGYAVLHEPWFALMGLAIDDPNYTANMARTLDYQRDHAVEPDGMVKSRWAYFPGDSKPGTYDANGFYECQWGRLMDTQTSYAINVAEQFDLSGDMKWLRGQKEACESALDYLLKRDINGNGLVEMETDSRSQHKASDWLDVVWASFESAFVNAQLYRALDLWASIERDLGDDVKAEDYRARALKLKTSFNEPVSEGGFWNPEKGWYVYWRDKDGSVHGDNLTIPVNFMAVGYGVCTDSKRRARILDRIEEEMAKEKLFCWPANIFPFPADETNNQPFPTYENGDIFMAWAELGIRAYAAYKPEIALKYLKQVLHRYEKDGLAFQRYLRKDQAGAGDDILANNCSAVVGLYRNIYGIQPRSNRLYLEPHLPEELAGTQVRYRLRGQEYSIYLKPNDYRVENGNWSVRCRKPFGIAFYRDQARLFQGQGSKAAKTIRKPSRGRVELEFE